MQRYAPLAHEEVIGLWDNVVILADSELYGIASEASIAFVESPQVHANY